MIRIVFFHVVSKVWKKCGCSISSLYFQENESNSNITFFCSEIQLSVCSALGLLYSHVLSGMLFGTNFYARSNHSYICCLTSDDFWAATNELVQQCCPGFRKSLVFIYFLFTLYSSTRALCSTKGFWTDERIAKCIDNNNYLTLP